MIILSGLRPVIDIDVVYTGLRPGEKLYEELFTAMEQLEGTEAESVFIASPGTALKEDLDAFIVAAERVRSACPGDQSVRLLQDLVPEAKLRTPTASPAHGADTQVIEWPKLQGKS
jgi:FlaA1/EpsC-like NDP-sugar epimerase